MDGLHFSSLQKNVIFGIFVFITILIFYSIFSTIENNGKYTLIVQTTPTDAKITINDVPSSQQTSLYPGVYTIKIEKDGFATDTQTVNLEKDYGVSSILIAVDSKSEEWVKNNLDEYPEDYDFKTTQQKILNQLPYENTIYSISVEEKSIDETPMPITIKSFKGYYNAAVDMVRELGYEPENYVYKFNYENPFK